MRARTAVALWMLGCWSAALAAEPKAKMLIEFGWDEPDAAFMRQHIAEMEKRPFDGTVFDISAVDGKGKRDRFIEFAWGKRRFTEQELAGATADLKATAFKRFTENFLRFDVTPGDVDWFDDFSSIVENARLAGKVAHEGAARGILFDCEPYNKPLWDYRQQRDHQTKSFDQYAAQARLRGREFMKAIRSEYPDVTIFLTFGYTIAAHQGGKLAEIDYGLYPAFLNGMLDEAAEGVRIVDGYEPAYGFKEAKQFDEALVTMRTKALPLVADRAKHQKHFSCGFGIWMDYDWRKHGWDTSDFTKNFFTPEVFEKSVRMALERCDEYVWVYTEKPKWWSPPDGKATDLPAAYEQALRRAAGVK